MLSFTYIINQICFNLVWIGSFVTALLNYKKKNLLYLIFVLAFLGGFTYIMLCELKCIYLLPWFYFMIPLTVYGINDISNVIENKILIKTSNS